MDSLATKTTKLVTAAPQKAAGTSFFRKAGDAAFFNDKKTSSFFGAPVQAKLTISSPDDPKEKEADNVAEKVMRMQDPMPAPITILPAKEEQLDRKEEKEIQPKLIEHFSNKILCKEDNEEKLSLQPEALVYKKQEEQFDKNMMPAVLPENNSQTLEGKNISLYRSDTIQLSGRGPPEGDIPFQQNLSASKGSGSSMPDATRTFMEDRFNADFSKVRVHTGINAQQMSTHIQAQAFAHGNDIYFNEGKYAPGSSGGRLLLAHELTHTIQQGASPANNTVATKISRKSVPEYSSTQLHKKYASGNSFDSSQTNIYRVAQPVATNAPAAANIDISNKEGGSALPDDAQDFFQDSYNTNVSDIRIHLDSEAADICRSRHVAAFTQGRHICFDLARYSPDSDAGGILLAKQVGESLAQRSMNIPGLMSQISSGGKVNNTPVNPAKNKQAATKELPSAKNKNKKGTTENSEKGAKQKGKVAKHKGKHKAGSGDGPPVKSVKPNPKKSPSSPDEDAAFQQVIGNTKATSKKQKAHAAAESKATDAQKASPPAPNEAESKAQERKTDGIEGAAKEDKPFDEKSFREALLKKIEDVTPKTLEEATDFKDNNKVGEVKNAMGQTVAAEKRDTAGPVTEANAQPLQVNDVDNKHPVALPPTTKGAKPAGVGAQAAAPKQKLDNEITLQAQSKSLDEEMKANNVTEEQLAKSNEPSFTAALDEKKGAQKDAAEKPKQYRKDETLMLNQAKATAMQQSGVSLTGMDTARGKNFDMVVQHQQTTKDKDNVTRANVAKDIEAKYAAAEVIVKKALEDADTQSNQLFDEGAAAASNAFENYVDARMTAYKKERYSGFWGRLRWAKDKLLGMPDKVNTFYTAGRQLYLEKMNIVITQVANLVTSKLNEAKQAIKDGKKQIDNFVSKLPEDLAAVGKEAAENIQDKFDTLEQSVNDKKDQLIDSLAKKYVDNVKKIDDRIDEMKEANKRLVDKAIGLLKKVWQVIKDLTNLFTSILSKLAAIIGVILSNPSGFFENLGRAFKLGFNNFKDKFLDYLEKGLMDWLAVNLGIAGIELPAKFDPMAIFTLVLQVLGVTKQHVKEKAVTILGEKKVAVLETTGGMLHRIYNEGLGALWEMIEEKLTDLKDVVWETIKSFMKTKIIEAALAFLLGLLTPVGAFVKVCMAIYDFLMMLVSFKDRIMELLDSILKAVTDIASGAIDGAANTIEKAFAKSIPVIIGFLAALLHVTDIAAKIKDIITRIASKVDKAIEFAIHKAAGFVKGAGKGLTAGGKKVVGAVKNLLGKKEDFKASDGTSHSLFFSGNEKNPELMVATTALPVIAALDKISDQVEKEENKGYKVYHQNASRIRIKIFHLTRDVQVDTEKGYNPEQIENLNALFKNLSENMAHLMPLIAPEKEVANANLKFGDLLKFEDINKYATISKIENYPGAGQDLINFEILNEGNMKNIPRGYLRSYIMKGLKSKTITTQTAAAPKRQLYMGTNPKINSDVGDAIKKRMKKMNRYDTNEHPNQFQDRYDPDKWHSMSEANLGHVINAVNWWNSNGRFTGIKSKEVETFMKDADNYELDDKVQNQKRGSLEAAENVRYLNPAK